MVSNTGYTAPILTSVIVLILICPSHICLSKHVHTIVKRNLGQFTYEIIHYCGWVQGYELMDYGCYCGQGGYGEPMDNLDRCCKAHDNCYGELEQQNYYTNWYDYKLKRTTIECDGAYHRKLCECDKILLECVLRSEYHSEHYNNCSAYKK